MQIHKHMQRQKLILESKNIYKSILILAIPIFLSNFMKAMNGIIDLYFVSNFIGTNVDDAIAAVNVTNPIFFITQAVAGGFMVAGAAMIAQFLGAKKKENARKIVGQLLLLCLISGVIMNVLLFILAPNIIKWMNAEGELYNLMVSYVRIRSFEMVPLFAFFAFQASRVASGDTMSPFRLNLIMIFFNVTLTFIFIYFLKLGVAGAALGTVLGNVIIMPIFMILLFGKTEKNITIKYGDIRFDLIELKKIFKLSWPISISQAMTSFGFLLLNTIILTYGKETVSAFAVGNNINSLILMPAMGIGAVTATFVGQNIGANNIPRARESVKSAMILSVLFAIIGAAIVFPFTEQLSALFLKEVPLALDKSVEYLFFLLAGLPLMAVIQVFMGAYQGSGETMYSFLISMVRLWMMRIPMVLLFKNVLYLPESSIWYAMVFSNFAACYLGTVLYSRCKFKPKVKLNQEKDLDLCKT